LGDEHHEVAAANDKVRCTMTNEIPKVLILEDEDGCSAIWLQTGFVSQGTTPEFAVENLVDAIRVQEKLERDLGREPWVEWEPASPVTSRFGKAYHEPTLRVGSEHQYVSTGASLQRLADEKIRSVVDDLLTGSSYKSIAEKHGVEYGNVKTIVARARKRWKELRIPEDHPLLKRKKNQHA
jgi:hypothetical protein